MHIVETERRSDARGYFARVWCRDELAQHDLDPTVVQVNTAFNPARGTLRGLHYQREPHGELKFVRCTRGAVFDVAVDLRPDSPTFKKWIGVELSAENARQLWIPKGCAHGYQTLSPDTELLYTTSAFYAPDSVRGVRYDDRAFNITWPLEVTAISDADREWPDFKGDPAPRHIETIRDIDE